MRHSSIEFLWEGATQVQMWMIVLEIELQHAESTHPRADPNAKKCAAVRERIIGPVLQVHIIRSLGNYGIEIQYHPRQ